jgi:CMP/dCMP kinase
MQKVYTPRRGCDSPGGEIGRRKGLKIPRDLNPMPVRFRPRAPILKITMNNLLIPIITLDGPSGSGKGTVGKLLAKRLGWHFLDSGSIYRILAFAALEKNINSTDKFSLKILAANLNIEFKEINKIWQIFLSDKDITMAIRSEKCGEMASQIAVLSEVRMALLDIQRNFRQFPGLIADGRDMGTVVFPDAKVKIFLTATPEKRAMRRYKQLQAQNVTADLQEILIEIKKRDARDEKREIAPLKPAKDAAIIDTTDLTIDDVVEKIIDQLRHSAT